MSESVEMYLETIHVLEQTLAHVRSIDIVHKMNFSKPTVSQQMKRLKEKRLVDIDDNGYITLTDTGRHIAEMIYERHEELTAIFEYIGVDQSIATEDACRVEHYISPETFDALKQYFDPLMKK
ncbi:MAG: metal-dependent transcriptional regulator [Erysipelotrichaceae bacterium]|nr:metal-dependent transcriptional regulator [Erysipelotrichaceae bacterium]